mgnify:CR=1 FL=1
MTHPLGDTNWPYCYGTAKPKYGGKIRLSKLLSKAWPGRRARQARLRRNDVCFTNHADADVDDMDALLTLLCSAGVNFIMGVPGADDIMLNYQSTSFHDALAMRQLLGLRAAPEFERWLERMGIADTAHGLRLRAAMPASLGNAVAQLQGPAR